MGAQVAADLPETMTAMGFDDPGGPDVLRPETLPVPEPGENQVLIRVSHAGINRPDVIQRQGFYPPPPGASPIPGLEVSGTVVATGPGVGPEVQGRRVCALVSGGGYAEYAVADAGSCLPLPEGCSFEQGAALTETMMTVWTNVFDVCALKPGETFMVHGGTSGIGVSAIQMAKQWGCKVLTTAGSEEKCIAAKTFGADRAINYKTEDFEAVVKEEGGVDVILDMVGGDYVQKNINCLNKLGRLVNIAYMQGPKTELMLMPFMLKRLTMTGSTLRARTPEEKRHVRDGVERDFWGMIAEDKINPVVYKVFPMVEIEAAHALMESSQHIGKIVIKTG